MKKLYAILFFVGMLILICDANASVVTNDYFGLNYVSSLSKFRSGAGHDYSYEPLMIQAGFYEIETDPTEINRSMKHYFVQYAQYVGDNTTVPIFAPFAGSIYRVSNDGMSTGFVDKQVWIRSDNNPDYFAIIFHVNLSETFPQIWNDYPQGHWPHWEPDDQVYDRINVVSGETIGFADSRGGKQASDIAILRKISATEYHYVSYFDSDVMPGSIFANYQARGVSSREDLIISKEFRDLNPVDWWETYNPDDYVNLNPAPVPIPGAVWLLGSGLIGLAGARRKFKK
jgi:hypothetical protein